MNKLVYFYIAWACGIQEKSVVVSVKVGYEKGRKEEIKKMSLSVMQLLKDSCEVFGMNIVWTVLEVLFQLS